MQTARGHDERGVERWKLVGALVVAPVFGVPLTLVGYAVLNLLQVDGFRGNMSTVWYAALNFALATLVVSYIVQAALGAPISFLLARHGRFSLGRMVVLGGICGALPFLIGYLFGIGDGFRSPREDSTLVFGGLGSAYGAAIAAATYGLARA